MIPRPRFLRSFTEILIPGLAVLLATVLAPVCTRAAISSAPSYSAQSIVHAATQTPAALAPNTIATIYGTNLSNYTVSAGNLPIGQVLPDLLGGVTVVVGGYIANLFYVSPTQINFLVPYFLLPGPVIVFVAHDSLSGPDVQIQLNAAAPAGFLWNGYIIASHLDGSLVTPSSPASGGEIVIIYVAGLGRVSPDTTSGRLAPFAASIVALSQTQVLLSGVACPQSSLLYVGLAPGFAGLYQVNLRLPPVVPRNPEFRIQVGSQISPPGIQLALQ